MKTENRMIDQYFDQLKKYYERYGRKTILLWQCGSFYEVYTLRNKQGEFVLSQFNDFLQITHMNSAEKHLLYHHNNEDMDVLMAGFTADDYYLTKYTNILVNEGFTVPVWYEYALDGKKKKRKELHVFSPGTNFCTHKEHDANIICTYTIKKSESVLTKNPRLLIGCTAIDIFTGSVKLFQHTVTAQNIHTPTVFDELDRFNSIYNPTETIIIHNYGAKINDIIQFASLHTKSIHLIDENENTENAKLSLRCEQQVYQKEILTKFYNIPDYDSYMESSRLVHNPMAFKSLCFLLDFIYCHNPNLTYKLHTPTFDNINNRLVLANHSLRQLNIVNESNIKGQCSSVQRLINKCVTPMGRRHFKDLILHPITNIEYLNEQYDVVDYIQQNLSVFLPLRKKLATIKDIEYLYRKIVFNRVSPAELFTFASNLQTIIDIQQVLQKDEYMSEYIDKNISIDIIPICNKIYNKLNNTIVLSLCKDLNNKLEVNFFQKDIYADLDNISNKHDTHLYLKNQIIKTLSSLIRSVDKKVKDPVKVHFTDKYGMYFYATAKRCKVLKECISSQNILTPFDLSTISFTSGGISNNTKFMGDYLKKFYRDYLSAQSELAECLKYTYTSFVNELKNYDNELSSFVKYVSELDIIINKAYISDKYNYCKPIIQEREKAFIQATELRHPLIEQIQTNELYVPNDVSIGDKFDGMLIYGTNGVGKSSINRSIGISIIMAQAGMFVPCSQFTYSPYTAIYTRILGNDNIFKGLSTFAVEMCEISTIVNNCDKNSLILGDEVCSGTETASAVSIFAQTLLHLDQKHCSHIFATHFHQINKMTEITSLEKLTIKHMSVKCDCNGTLFYTRKLEDGPGVNMYGLEVCKSFDFSSQFLQDAYNLRQKYYKDVNSVLKKNKTKYSRKKIKGRCEFCKAAGVDIHHLRPQKKANIKNFIGSHHKNHPANLVNICKPCHLKLTKENRIHKKVKTTKGYTML